MKTPDREFKSYDPFDLKHSELEGLPDAGKSKATTVVHLEPVVGTSTYIVQTIRQRGEEDTPARDTIFIQFISGEKSFRIYLPPPVANLIARQRDALGTKMRKAAARQEAARRKAAGIKPAFLKIKKGGAS